MSLTTRIFKSIVIAVLAGGCIEPFAPEIEGDGSVLVVEGFVSDSEEPYTISLSRTRPSVTSQPIPELAAMVTITDEEGAVYPFQEQPGGVYTSSPEQFVGRVGATYRLGIETADGRQYTSTDVVLKQSAPIDSVYWQREVRLSDVDGLSSDGVAIKVDAHNDAEGTRLYRYDYIETYEVRPHYASGWEYNTADNSITVRKQSLTLCYTADTSNTILTTSTKYLSADIVSALEVAYVTSAGFRLKGLYSILVRQYALDDDGFRYWQELHKSSQGQGTLFDPQPYELRGNIANIADPDEPVLGYFDASTVSERRLFIDRSELQQLDVVFPRDPCRNELDSIGSAFDFNIYLSWGYLIVSIEPLTMIPPDCGDCRYHGTLEKPYFWPE